MSKASTEEVLAKGRQIPPKPTHSPGEGKEWEYLSYVDPETDRSKRDWFPVDVREREELLRAYGNHAVCEAYGRIPQHAVTGYQMRDRRRNDFHARHQGIERRRKEISAAGDRRPEHNNSIPDRIRSNLARQRRNRTDRPDGAALTIKRYRENMIDVGGNGSFAEHQTVRLDGGLTPDRKRGNAKRKR